MLTARRAAGCAAASQPAAASHSHSAASATAAPTAGGGGSRRGSALAQASVTAAVAPLTLRCATALTKDDLEFGRPLGKGRFGAAYAARAKRDGTEYAVKVMNKAALAAAGLTAQCEAEIELHGSVAHPNVIRLVAAFQDDTRVYLVLEYAADGNLYRLLSAAGALPEADAARRVAEVACGLAALHAAAVVHRDVKPENVLLCASGATKLSDMGAAARLAGGSGGRRSTLCGTREYLAPEMLAARPYGASVDVWALGVVAYELLYGVTPFVHRSADDGALLEDDTFAAIAAGAVAFPPTPATSAAAKDFITAALTLDADARPSAAALCDHAWLAPLLAPPTPDGVRTVAARFVTPLPRPQRPRLSTESAASACGSAVDPRRCSGGDDGRRITGGARRVSADSAASSCDADDGGDEAAAHTAAPPRRVSGGIRASTGSATAVAVGVAAATAAAAAAHSPPPASLLSHAARSSAAVAASALPPLSPRRGAAPPPPPAAADDAAPSVLAAPLGLKRASRVPRVLVDAADEPPAAAPAAAAAPPPAAAVVSAAAPPVASRAVLTARTNGATASASAAAAAASHSAPRDSCRVVAARPAAAAVGAVTLSRLSRPTASSLGKTGAAGGSSMRGTTAAR